MVEVKKQLTASGACRGNPFRKSGRTLFLGNLPVRKTQAVLQNSLQHLRRPLAQIALTSG